MDATPSDHGGGGMSRAAKKRAKKNKRKQQEQASESAPAVSASLTKKSKISSEKDKASTKADKSATKADESGLKKSDIEKNTLPDITASDEKEPKQRIEENEDDLLGRGLSLERVLLLDEETKPDRVDEILRNITAKQRARASMRAMIDPIPLSRFYEEFWEKKPVVIKAETNARRYDGLLSLEGIREMSEKKSLYYARDLNVTKYEKDAHGVKRRITLDKLPENERDEVTGVLVDSSELWKHYDSGCTIRLLCPHKHEDAVHALLSTLELELGCMVGANAYLTPPNASQGFAPHYDDIEAFCLQLQGKKRWKVYEPTLKLPRESSSDFTAEDVKEMKQVMDVTLEPGDILYMPRGWIHQACTLPHSDEHSLHLTVSAMQNWSWVDLMEMVMPNAVEAAAMSETSASLRQGLPRGFLDYMGTMHDTSVDESLPESMKKVAEGDDDDENDDDEFTKATKLKLAQQRAQKEKFKEEAKKRIMKVAKAAMDMVDDACDQLGKRFQSDRLPPAFTPAERADTNLDEATKPEEQKVILPATLCRIARPGIARLVLEDDHAIVYHCSDNARVYRAAPISPLEFETDDGPALEQLLTTEEPGWIPVHELIHDTIQDKVAIAQALYDDGILAIRNAEEGNFEVPGQMPIEEDDDSDDGEGEGF